MITNSDRVVSSLFVMTLVHGVVILGVSFDWGRAAEPPPGQSLEVVLVANPNPLPQAQDDARYLSEHNLAGGGTTVDDVRPQIPASSNAPTNTEGTPDGRNLRRKRVAQPDPAVNLVVAKQLSTDSLRYLRRESEVTEPENADARLLLEQQRSPELIQDAEEQLALTSERERELFVSVNTRESKVARYLALWKRKIEQVGTLNYPDEARRLALTGNPTLEVAIMADGNLLEIILRESSGESLIDEAAMRILRLAAPFDPFPQNLRGEYDVLRFRYQWQFIGGDGFQTPSQMTVDGS